LPIEIPEHVEVSIEGLNIGDAVYARDLQIPEGAELMLDGDEPVVSIGAPISEEDLEVRVDEGLLDELVDLEAEEAPAEAAEEAEAAAEEAAEEAEEASDEE
ncbi:MAG: 50S ribosomal protein L25, partial [Armatimonadetes bacterium]|nr:50S ribosomal protein L25 [Armatimonadota bacterium]